MRGFSTDHVLGDRMQAAVVNRVGDEITPPGATHVRLNLDVDCEALRTSTLCIGHAVTATEHHALEQDPVHPVIVAPLFFIDFRRG